MIQRAPLKIENFAQQNVITLHWSNTERQTISCIHLRSACPCAKCRAARLQGRITLVDEAIHIAAINNMVYGVQLVFSDGHDRGIYPWSYLRELM